MVCSCNALFRCEKTDTGPDGRSMTRGPFPLPENQSKPYCRLPRSQSNFFVPRATGYLITHEPQLRAAGPRWHGFRRLHDDPSAGLTLGLTSPAIFRRRPAIVSVPKLRIVRNQDGLQTLQHLVRPSDRAVTVILCTDLPMTP